MPDKKHNTRSDLAESANKILKYWHSQPFSNSLSVPDLTAELQAAFSHFDLGNQFFYLYDYRTLTITYITSNFKTILGYEPEGIGLEFIYDLMHPDDRWKVLKITRAAAELAITNKQLPIFTAIRSNDVRMRKADNTYIKMLQQTFLTQRDEAGNAITSGGIFTDISHLNRDNEVRFSISISEFDQQLRQIMAKNELNNPLLLLSAKEIEIARYLIEGWSSKEIAEELALSPFTIDTHRKNIKQKLKVKNTSELISHLIERGLR